MCLIYISHMEYQLCSWRFYLFGKHFPLNAKFSEVQWWNYDEIKIYVAIKFKHALDTVACKTTQTTHYVLVHIICVSFP